jgi:hypothetical protein
MAVNTSEEEIMISYNPHNWYWVGPLGVFSSASQSIVPTTDPAYIAWLAEGGLPTNWPKDASGAQTTEALDEVLAPYGLSTGLTFSSLKPAVMLAASNVCSAVIDQIIPDSAHATALQNAASMVNANGGNCPTTAPLAAKFAAMATAFLAPSAEAFAQLVVVIQGANLDLSTALAEINGAATMATTVGQLQAAVLAFETAINAVVAEINAVVPLPITAPTPLVIKGVNS